MQGISYIFVMGSFKLFLLESMYNYYSILGVNQDDDLDTIKKAYRKLAMKYHPDRNPGDEESVQKFKTFQNAWENILLMHKQGKPAPTYQPDYGHQPDWETDPRSSYHHVGEDHRNLNFNKKYLYEKALEAENGDRSKLKKMTVWAFDGDYSRGVFSVWGSDKIYPEIAKAMHIWNSQGSNRYPTKMVLISTNYSNVRIIWINGKNVDIPVKHESFNNNPFNDPHFVKKLQEMQ